MPSPFDQATAHPPPTLGEGCTRRYDPAHMSDETGTEFPGAAELWRRVQPGTETPPSANADEDATSA